MWKLFKKKIKTIPNERRIPIHEAELFYEMLHAQAIVPIHSIKKARIKKGATGVAKDYVGEMVHILFYGKLKCEVELANERGDNLSSFFIHSAHLDLGATLEKPFGKEIEPGEYVTITKDIYADDGSKDLIAEEDDEALLLFHSDTSNYPFWVYVYSTNEYVRVKKEEINRDFKRILLEFR